MTGTAQFHGRCDPKFEAVRGLLQQFVDSGEELGASLVVNVDGDDVVDLWGGYADADRTRPWNEDTVVTVFSSTKNVTSLAILMLVERNLLSIDDKVAKYWPEFAANGKEDVEIRHLLSHTSGVGAWEDPMALEDLCNTEECTARLAKQAPWWTPGTASGYHSLTFGFLLGEIVRRITGLSLKEFIRTNIASPLGADFQLGAVEEDWPRISNMIPPPPRGEQPPAMEPDSIPMKFMNPLPTVEFANTPAWRQAEIGAANGFGNAKSLARILSEVTLAGKEDTKGLLSKQTVDLIFKEQSRGPDVALGIPLRFGVGFALTGDGDTSLDDFLPSGKICLWGGWGGSMAIMDVERGVTITYAMNKMSNEGPGTPLVKAYLKAIYEALGVSIN
ncbi:beta-lactamase-2 [Coleophoma crateriformis]|uniref:Beta-lactamase-2 n=1 Tax=Coleophoma crateriformis TaxID=565419 RepID=A0A3D8S9P8_9HELO|nr:beta-lactamase-2 [Coleophoma crateriformis]